MGEDGSIVFRVDADDAEAQKKLSQLRKDIEKTAKAVDASQSKKNGIVAQLEEARETAKKTGEEIERIKESLAEREDIMSGKGEIDFPHFMEFLEDNERLKTTLTEQEQLYARQQATVAKLQGQEQQIEATLQQQTAELERQRGEAGAVERHLANQSASVLPQLREATEAVTKSMRKGVKSILKWGFGIRSAFILMRRLRSAVVEGVKAFAEQDEETKRNLTELKNSLSTLKASWGAAFAPILNAVAPLLQKLISWLTAAANAVQMFFAVLGGKTTYKRAIANNEALAESVSSTGSAAEDAEKQLMGFDKINKVNDNSSSSGGGSGASTGQQFEEVEIDPKKLAFLQAVKDHLREIGLLAGAVAAALLAWKISSALDLSFQTVFGVLLTILGTIVFIKEGFDAWQNGVDWDNLIGMIEGAAIAVVGLGLAFGTTGAAIGLLVAGIAMLVIGIRDWIKNGELSTQTFTMLEFAIAAVGVALALLTGSWIPLLVAGLVGAALAIYKNWDSIKEWWTGKVVPKLEEGVQAIAKGWDNLKQWAGDLLDGVSEKFNSLKEKISGAWTIVIQKTEELKTRVNQKWTEIKTGISTRMSSIKTDITSGFTQAKTTVVQKITDMWTSVTTKFESIRSSISSKVQAIKGLLNFSWSFPKPKMPHFSWYWQDVGGLLSIPRFTVDWYAKGGVFDTASLIGVGENGKEAVVPLERNTEWITGLADTLLDRMASSRFADYITGRQLPAFATGQLVPPRAVDRESMFSDSDMKRLAAALASVIGGSGDGKHIHQWICDGRVLAEIVDDHNSRKDRSGGSR